MTALAGTANDPMRDYNGGIENLAHIRDTVNKGIRAAGGKVTQVDHKAIADNEKRYADVTDDVAQMDFKKWIQLTIAGFQHQDPMNPKDPGSVTAELANVGMAVGFSKIPKELAEVRSLISKSMSLSASGRVGQKVEAQFNQFKLSEGKAVDLGFDLPVSAQKVEVTIYDEKSQFVRKMTVRDGDTINVDGKDEIVRLDLGRNNIKWDGLKPNGSKADDGKYNFQVRAFDKNDALIKDPNTGKNLMIRKYMQGTFEASFMNDDGKNYVMVDGIEMPFDAIKKFYGGRGGSDSKTPLSKGPESEHPMPNSPVFGPETFAQSERSKWKAEVNRMKEEFTQPPKVPFSEADMPEGLSDI